MRISFRRPSWCSSTRTASFNSCTTLNEAGHIVVEGRVQERSTRTLTLCILQGEEESEVSREELCKILGYPETLELISWFKGKGAALLTKTPHQEYTTRRAQGAWRKSSTTG
jgi:hypothetical protein